MDESTVYAGTLLVLILGSLVGLGIAAGQGESPPVSNATGEYETTDAGVRYTVPPADLIQGCPGGKDCIPSIDNPRFQDPDDATWLEPNDRVIGVVIDGHAKAYPLRILNVHEIVNDELAGKPIAVTYCPLCRSGLVFSRVVNEAVLSFGVSGKLINANLVMYDRQTDTYWSQVEGAAIVGPLVPTDLQALPSSITTWQQWRNAHPETRVLSRNTGIYPKETYNSNPYGDYENSSRLGPGVDRVDDRLPPKEIVYGVAIGEHANAYPEDAIKSKAVINDNVGGVPVAIIEDQRDGGVDVFIREAGNETITLALQNGTLVDDSGSEWTFDGEAVTGPHAGARLERLESHGFFWFAWSSFHPETDVYQE